MGFCFVSTSSWIFDKEDLKENKKKTKKNKQKKTTYEIQISTEKRKQSRWRAKLILSPINVCNYFG